MFQTRQVSPNSSNVPSAAALALEAEAILAAGNPARAQELLRRAVHLDPHLAGAWQALGVAAYRSGRTAEAYTHFQRGVSAAEWTLRRKPDSRPSMVARAGCAYALSRPAEATESARQALAIAPDADLHRTLLCMMNFLSDTTPESRYAEARRWAALHADPLAPEIRPHPNLPLPGRRIRLAYLSPDLYNHAIVKFLQPVFEHHDRSQFELFVYSTASRVDEHTAKARAAVPNFVPFSGSARDLAARIRADGIDILVDLAGHTMPWQYLQTYALKPAPIQVTWTGLMATTGLTTMDYFVGDSNMPCPGTESCFTETIYRLPRVAACYRPMADNVPVVPSPCLQRGYITFGCFNQPTKLTREVVQVWSGILRAVPRSRLRLKYNGLESEVMQKPFQAWFSKEGIARGRVEFAGPSTPAEYLAAYGEIDIALDPFPYNGGSTSLDAVYMGVPMVTLTGRLPVQCGGASLLRSIGLPDSVTESPADYHKAALFLAEIVGRIPQLRENVRKAFLTSPFLDEAGLVRTVETGFRDMWRTWCRKQPVIVATPQASC